MNWWKLVSLSGVAVMSLLIDSGLAAAQMYGGNVERRLDQREEMIRRGVQSGALTPQEARKLTKEQQRLERQVDRIQADGRITPQERFRLQHKLDQADRRLYRELHDRQVAYPGYGAPSHPPAGPRWHNKKHGRPHGPDGYSCPRPQPQAHLKKHQSWPRAQMRPYHQERQHRPWPWQRERRLAGQYW